MIKSTHVSDIALFAGGHARQNLPRHLRHEGISENVIGIPRATVHFGTTTGNVLDETLVVDEGDIPVLSQPLAGQVSEHVNYVPLPIF